MLDLGVVRPGSTIRIPFSSFDKDDGSSITMTNFAAADILVYKDGSTTERASTSGFTATTDFDAKTGKHLAIIDLSDDTTSGFWQAGSEYLVAIDAVTIDAVTTGGWIARFRIGQRAAIFDTTIATLASQTSFTLTTGPAEDSAILGMWVLLHSKASAVQMAWAVVSAYTGSTKTVTLAAAPTFTIAAGDNVSIMDRMPLQPTTFGRSLDISTGGEAGIDWANVGSPTTSLNLSGTTISTSQQVDLNTIKTQTVTCSGGVTIPAATLASTTNITAGTITTATNVTTVNGLAAGVITAASIAADAIGASELAADAVSEIAAGVWDLATTGHTTAGTFGAAMNAAGSAGDPWATSLPGSYTGTQAGKMLSDAYAAVDTETSAASIRAAIGLASANLDTQIATLATASALSSLVTTVGAAGAGLTALAPASTALSTATWTTARAGYLDALNGGIVVKRNTALAAFEFLMVLSSDHVTGATGKTITATRSIDGGAFASCTNSATEVSNGIYKINLTAADLNGTTVTLRFTAASCDDTFITILTQP